MKWQRVSAYCIRCGEYRIAKVTQGGIDTYVVWHGQDEIGEAESGTAAREIAKRHQGQGMADYRHMSMDRLRNTAATEHEKQDEAARVFVDRLLDLEVERRLVLAHERPGWHNCSPGFGDGTGGSTAPSDAMFQAYIKGIRVGGWHERAGRAVRRLPERWQFAALVQSAKSDPRIKGPMAAKYEEIAEHIGLVAQYFGWPSVAPLPPDERVEWQQDEEGKRKRVEISMPAFSNGQAIKRAAWEAQYKLLAMAKTGII